MEIHLALSIQNLLCKPGYQKQTNTINKQAYKQRKGSCDDKDSFFISVVTMSGLSICITVNTTNAPIDKTEPKIKFPEILNLFLSLSYFKNW